MRERNLTVDILRIIGTLLVILAHCGFSNVIFEMRNFDVIMLVFISGMSFSLSTKKYGLTIRTYFSYVFVRIKRLLVPTWFVLFMFFVVFCGFFGNRYSLTTIAKSFMLLSGIGYVWIIRIYISLAVFNPLVVKWSISSKFSIFLIVTLGTLVLNELLVSLLLTSNLNDITFDIISITLNYTSVYLIVSMFGIRWNNMRKHERMCVFFLFSSILLFLLIYGNVVSIQSFKYPPMLVYSSYGLCMSMILYTLFERIKVSSYLEKIIFWISSKSLWIYLWHILVLSLVAQYDTNLAVLHNPVVKFILVAIGSIIITIFQDILQSYLKSRKKWRVL